MTFPIFGSVFAPDLTASRVPAARKGAAGHPAAAAPVPDLWTDLKTVVEIGFAVVRVVELVILFA